MAGTGFGEDFAATDVATGVALGDATVGEGESALGDAGNALGEGELADGRQEPTRSAHRVAVNTNVWRCRIDRVS